MALSEWKQCFISKTLHILHWSVVLMKNNTDSTYYSHNTLNSEYCQMQATNGQNDGAFCGL